AAVHHAGDVNIDNLLVAFGADVLKAVDLQNAGAVKQQAQLLFVVTGKATDYLPALLGIAYVQRITMNTLFIPAERQLAQAGLINVRQPQLPALRVQGFGGGQTDAGGGTGNKGG